MELIFLVDTFDCAFLISQVLRYNPINTCVYVAVSNKNLIYNIDIVVLIER
jgi:hypothetical protein